MKASQHKQLAKRALKGKWGLAIGVFFIYLILGGISGMLPEDYFLAGIILYVFISAPLSVGYSWFYLDVKRLSNPKIEVLFDGFSKNYIRNILASVFVTVFTTLWTLLFIIPGIIKGLAYSMTLYILRDRPELSALEAITESRRLMNGKKKNLFFLILSFIGWIIVPGAFIIIGGGIAFGIGASANGSITALFMGLAAMIIGMIAMFAISIYLTPYYMTTMAVFYDDFVKPKQEEPIITIEKEPHNLNDTHSKE